MSQKCPWYTEEGDPLFQGRLESPTGARTGNYTMLALKQIRKKPLFQLASDTKPSAATV